MKLIRKPKSFEIGARKIVFSRGPQVDHWLEEMEAVGACNYDKHEKIAVHSSLTESGEHVTNFHEIIHIILEHMRKPELSKDETFVDQFAENLYQVLKTLK